MPDIPAIFVDSERHPLHVIAVRILHIRRPHLNQPCVLLHVKDADDGCRNESGNKAHPCFDPSFVKKHAHDLAFTFSRKISFNEIGSTSMLPARSMRACSTMESTLWLATNENARPAHITLSM